MEEIHYLLGHTCNLDCDFCFWEKRTSPPTIAKAKKVIGEIKKVGIKKITISGGEPTCSSCLLEVLKYAKLNGMEIALHTNGLKIDAKMAQKIAPFIQRISLALDGSDESMAIKMRKKPFTKHTLSLVTLFDSLGTAVSVKTLVTKVNQEDIVAIGKLLENKPIRYWSIIEFNPLGRGLIHKKKFLLSRKEFALITKKVLAHFPNLQIRIREFRGQPEKYCFITTSGEVYTNTKNNGDILVGNLETNSLSSILDSASFRN